MAFLTVAAISVSAVVNTIGVNTHLDSFNYGYQNLAATEAAIKYLGVKNLRDSAQSEQDLTIWREVARVTGACFDDYMGRGSPTQDTNDLEYVTALAKNGVLNFIEGGDENDVPQAVAKGNSIAWTANFQRQVFATGQSLGLPVINMSFGAGWTATNDWHGDYDKVGDLSPYANYANAHTYPGVGAKLDATIRMLNADALLAARSRPVITTEIGWNGNDFDSTSITRFVLDAVFDGIRDGDAKMYFYALFDDPSGKYGLMNPDGSPKPAGWALHNLTTILADTGVAGAGSLTYSPSGQTANDNALVLRKPNGALLLVVWNEIDPIHSVTVTLPKAAESVKIYDPMAAPAAQQIQSATASISLRLSNHPVIAEITP